MTVAVAIMARDQVFWIGALLGWTLLSLALIDIKTLLLPDALTLPLTVAGLIVTAIFDRDMVYDHLLAAVVAFCSFFAIAKTYRLFAGQEGLGLGDAKLFAATGAWLGALALPGALLIAALTALTVEVIRRGLRRDLGRSDQLAFGPYLAFATWLGWLVGPLVPDML